MAQHGPSIPPPDLDPQAVYLSPRGRRCRVHASSAAAPIATFATLIYDRADGMPCLGQLADGFTLSRANWHLLRQVQ